ncbi:MAG: hypothetical protein WA188_07180 [Terriglobales bacterium]
MKNLDQALTTHYRERSDHFYKAMERLANDVAPYSTYSTSIALLAVHSCISLNDAISVALTGSRCKHQDHLRAAAELEKICNTHRIMNQRGVDHLRWLLARKIDIAYGTKRLDSQFVASAKDKAEKFSAWAYNNFEGVLRGL